MTIDILEAGKFFIQAGALAVAVATVLIRIIGNHLRHFEQRFADHIEASAVEIAAIRVDMRYLQTRVDQLLDHNKQSSS